MARPVVLLAFANDWVDDKRLLRNLNAESKRVSEALAPLVERGQVELPPPVLNASVDDVLAAFRKPQYRDRICMFHFGGHANGEALMFEDAVGAPAVAHAAGLAGVLGLQHGLVLVFLNGCSTEPQVRALRAAGIKAVVATTRSVRDDIAASFASAFYGELATRPLQQAFDAAAHAMKLQFGDDPRSVLRDVAPNEPTGSRTWPWTIDCDPQFRDWRPRAKRGRYVAATVLALIVALFVASPAARHRVCSVPGVRAVCVATGIGDIPSAAEHDEWVLAIARDDSTGLRNYLAHYPLGTYASEAQARIAACTTTYRSTLGSEEDINKWPIAINPDRLRPFDTEDAARADALIRGRAEAKNDCDSLASSFDVLRTDVINLTWRCDGDAHGHICGFDGNVLCHVRSRIKVAEEHCKTND